MFQTERVKHLTGIDKHRDFRILILTKMSTVGDTVNHLECYAIG